MIMLSFTMTMTWSYHDHTMTSMNHHYHIMSQHDRHVWPWQSPPNFSLMAFNTHVCHDMTWQCAYLLNLMPSIKLTNPGWSSKDNRRWTALFQRFDVFQRWFREHENISADQRCFKADQSDFLWIRAVQNWFFHLWNVGFYALNSAEERWFSTDSLWNGSDI